MNYALLKSRDVSRVKVFAIYLLVALVIEISLPNLK